MNRQKNLAKLAIAVLLHEDRARALLEGAVAAGRLIDPTTVDLDGFVIMSERAFEELSKGLQINCGGAEPAAGAGASRRRSGRNSGEVPA